MGQLHVEMLAQSFRTGCVDVISSLHCAHRQREREIVNTDLQLAVRYGSRTLQTRLPNGAFKRRFKFEYSGITYITEADEKTAVTCYATQSLPIDLVPIDSILADQIQEQRRRISSGAIPITSHTVLCVDQSTSMCEGDCIGHRSHSAAAFYAIAMEMIATPLAHGLVSFTDVVTLIEMRDGAEIQIHMEPFSWELFDKIVNLVRKPLRARGNGNYIPALDLSFRALNDSDNKNCALLLMFLSDGRPSDGPCGFESPDFRIMDAITLISKTFAERLTFGAFGFSHNSGQFEMMRRMVAKASSLGCNGVFADGIDTQSIRLALKTVATGLTSTKTRLSSLAGGTLHRPAESKTLRAGLVKAEGGSYDSTGADVFNAQVFSKVDRRINEILKELKQNKDIVIKPADKNLGLTVMNTTDYIGMCEKHLNDTTTYKEIMASWTSDPALSLSLNEH